MYITPITIGSVSVKKTTQEQKPGISETTTTTPPVTTPVTAPTTATAVAALTGEPQSTDTTEPPETSPEKQEQEHEEAVYAKAVARAMRSGVSLVGSLLSIKA